MIRKIILPLIILAFLLIPAQSAFPASVEIEDDYFFAVIDEETGSLLLGKDADSKIYPASITKILTAWTALSNSGITNIYTASEVAAGPLESGAVRLGLVEGERMQLYDMLNALLLKSANDIAVAIAENVAGSVGEFAGMMNEMAAYAGAVNSNFTNPHGLHDDNHYTTPMDMALIARKADGNYTFSSIINKTSYTLSPTNKHENFPVLKNTHPILGENEGMDFLVTGGKTGYTSKAKCTLVTYARDFFGRSVICVVANIPTRELAGELSLTLIQRAFDEFAVQHVSVPGQIFTGSASSEFDYPVASAKGIEYLLPRNKSSWQLDTELVVYDIPSPQKGDIVGELSFTYKTLPVGSTYLVCASDVIMSDGEHEMFIASPKNTAAMPLRFLIPLSLAILLTLLIFIALRYNGKRTED